MKVINSLSEIVGQPPAVLTIGNFDGVHAGHKLVLEETVKSARAKDSQSVAITFFNHPKTVLKPEIPHESLCTFPHKVELIRKLGLDLIIPLKFSYEFSRQTAEEFLQFLLKSFTIHKLVLGEDATIGKNREGNKQLVKEFGKRFHFDVEYIHDLTREGNRISSSLIRKEIQSGNLQIAKELLGRPYSILSTVIQGKGKGSTLGYHTANIEVGGICLPPLGVYTVSLRHGDRWYSGIANLGIAPTVRKDSKPVLEVHILDHTVYLLDETVEVFLHDYIRPEKKFDSIEALKAQIAHDVELARRLLK